MLSVVDLHASYGPIEALKGVSMEVQAGEIVALIGANGAGKSTSLMTLSGVLAPQSGKIFFQGIPIGGLPSHEVVRLGISQVPEGRRIFPRLTVLENLELGGFSLSGKKEVQKQLGRVLENFPLLQDRQNQMGGTLSGGEQQMLAIGRALMSEPKLLLLDEPSLGLAPLMVEKIFELVRGINDRGTTILLVEQNAQGALLLAHRGYVIETGKVVLEGPSQSLLNNPMVKGAYLGIN